MSDSSLLMIHNAWTYAQGNSEVLRKTAEDLDIITQASVNAYKLTANISEEEIKNLMDNESWITAESAVEMGFATDIVNKKEDGVNQSAFDLIKGKLLAEPEQKGNEPNWEELAEKVAEKVKALLPEEKEEEEKVHEDVEQQQLSGWEAFFK
jgi:ATP-dependent Clp protease protease subunit